jgi:hypothetical protein
MLWMAIITPVVGAAYLVWQIASSTIEAWGKPHHLEFIAKFSGEQGSQLLMRLQKLDQSKKVK